MFNILKLFKQNKPTAGIYYLKSETCGDRPIEISEEDISDSLVRIRYENFSDDYDTFSIFNKCYQKTPYTKSKLAEQFNKEKQNEQT